MAEGSEETENSNADTPAMLSTILPCDSITTPFGNIKREIDQVAMHSSSPTYPNAMTPTPTPMPIPTTTATSTTTTSLSSTNLVSIIKRGTPSPSSTENVQQHPINLKSQDCDKEQIRLHPPTSPIAQTPENELETPYYKSITTKVDRSSPQQELEQAPKVSPTTAASQVHLNGTMQDMINLEKLQNFASLQHQHQQQHHHQHQHQLQHQHQHQHHQQQRQQHSSVPTVLAGLQGLAGIPSAAALNSPLNLSVGSTSTLSSTDTIPSASNSTLGSTGSGTGLPGCPPPPGCSQMPQLILASGQLVQGVQGAQLLIPTSQGVSIQTILTIPVSQQISTNEPFLQKYPGLGSTAGAPNFGTSPSLVSPHQIPLSPQSTFFKPNFFSNGVQQLLAALHPQLFSPVQHHHQQQQALQQHHPHQSQPSQSLHAQQMHLKHQPVSTQIQREALSPKVEMSPPHSLHQRELSPSSSTQLRRTPPQSGSIGPSVQHSKESPSGSSTFGMHLSQEKPSSNSTPPSNTNYVSPSGSQLFHTHSPNSHLTSSSHSLNSQVNSPSSACVLSSINRLTSSNGELTITKSNAPLNHSISALSSSSPLPSPGSIHHQNQSMKLSPSQMHLSPTGTETSTADLLVDSPNEPTISQTNCNVVDGIDLDEIKEFAKAFKLRRLSLGLTQTQVGQALSVTEGPAYSQSAICSALAAQMYAAQLSTQQQNMFEKLDITPKSAQKIKPVLERWMKEAEESHWNRYKTGQNHLTDFIGVEPSKKRKRRTSFTPQALELLNAHFERNTHPSGTEITGLAHQLGYEREVIRIWFCNKRQALKNTVRMMSKGMV